ncbi:MAG: hypothetical protein P8M25_03030 [Paracoccaceae bacterium]|nr:hypothetical protein [Paracoccaceae bacterium]
MVNEQDILFPPPIFICSYPWFGLALLVFPLNFRDVKEMLAEGSIYESYETIRRWVLKFGPTITAKVRSRRTQPSGTCHFDEVFVIIGDKRTYLLRTVYD